MYTVLAGGVGAARFLRGLVRAVDPGDITVIVNVADDLDLHGLRICPDLDTILYSLAGIVHPDQGWGRSNETFHASEELGRLGQDTWFRLGDRDIATHLFRSQQLCEGVPLSEVIAQLASAFEVGTRILPASDDQITTRIETRDGQDLHFQEYWVRERAEPEVSAVRFDGAEEAEAAPGVLDAIASAEVVMLAPSNPVVSIGAMLAVPEIRRELTSRAGPTVGVSPIVGGQVVLGMADKLLGAVGADVSAAAVAGLYRDFLDAWVLDRADLELVGEVQALGIETVVTDTMMDTVEVAESVARTVLGVSARMSEGWVRDPQEPSGGHGPTPGEAKRRQDTDEIQRDLEREVGGS